MKVYVGNLSNQFTDAELSDLAKPYGTIVSAQVVVDRKDGTSKGFGFIELSSPEEGRAAIAGLNGRDMNGRTLHVDEARARKAPAGF